MEGLAIFLSIFSTIIALISAYMSQFKKGKIALLPVRAYKVEPLNFNLEGESYRGMRLFLNLTFMNTGAITHPISDLRVKIPMKEKEEDLILEWECELPSLNSDFVKEREMASQCTLGPYASCTHVYTFTNKRESKQANLVSTLEEICEKEKNKFYPSAIEMRDQNNKWIPIRKMSIHHSGRIWLEADYEKINEI